MYLIQTNSFRLRRSQRHATHSRPLATPTVRRAKRSGGPQDRALYTCGCGFSFTAAVSTSVGCPHCGAHQAW